MDQPRILPQLIGLYSDQGDAGPREAAMRLQNYHGYQFFDYGEPIKLMIMPLVAAFGHNPRAVHGFAAQPDKIIPGVDQSYAQLAMRIESMSADILDKIAATLVPKFLKTRQRLAVLPLNTEARQRFVIENGGKLVKVTNLRDKKAPFADLEPTQRIPDFEITYGEDLTEITKGLNAMFRNFDA